MPRSSQRSSGRSGGASLCAAVLALAGCEGHSPQQVPPEPVPPAVAQPAERSEWRTIDRSAQVAVDEASLAEELAAASARARGAAEAARARWAALEPAAREGWAVKWGAPADDGGTEHVWVIPRSWSAFRIEGVLASPPQRALRCGRGRGEAVAFPVEELSDWVWRREDGTREGGFTMDVLERHFGRPEEPGSPSP